MHVGPLPFLLPTSLFIGIAKISYRSAAIFSCYTLQTFVVIHWIKLWWPLNGARRSCTVRNWIGTIASVALWPKSSHRSLNEVNLWRPWRRSWVALLRDRRKQRWGLLCYHSNQIKFNSIYFERKTERKKYLHEFKQSDRVCSLRSIIRDCIRNLVRYRIDFLDYLQKYSDSGSNLKIIPSWQ